MPENNKHVLSPGFCESGIWERLGCVSPEAAVKVLPGLHLSQGPARGGSTSTLTHMAVGRPY